MKGKIETAANVIVIIVAIVIGSVFLKDRLPMAAPQAASVQPGDKLANLEGWDWNAHHQTLVLALRKGCHFCEDSTPFYRRLFAEQQRAGTTGDVVAVFPDTTDSVTELIRSEGLDVHAVAGIPLDKLKVSATPTLLLVDKNGTVKSAWIGMLSPRQELEVMQATTLVPSASVQ